MHFHLTISKEKGYWSFFFLFCCVYLAVCRIKLPVSRLRDGVDFEFFFLLSGILRSLLFYIVDGYPGESYPLIGGQ
jgi:hypothetical protein